jgi:hypothetical protein
MMKLHQDTKFIYDSTICLSQPTAGVSRKWVGRDPAWEPKKLETKKNAHKSPRVPFVGW